MRRAPIAVLVIVSASAILGGPREALGRRGERAPEAAESRTVRGPIAAIDLDAPKPSIRVNEQGRVRVIPIEPQRLRVVYDGEPVGPDALEVGQLVRVRLIAWSGREVVKSIEIIRPGDSQDHG